MHALVVADGDRPTRAALDEAWPGWDRGIGLVVAADGGARLAQELRLPIDAWVGDGDSLGAAAVDALERAGVPTTRLAIDKDESDTELAVVTAVELGADDITILGALGGRRLDHALANIGLLAHPALVGRSGRLLDGTTRVSLVTAPGPDGEAVHAILEGRNGDVVSLLPLGDAVDGVTTDGLEYPLRDEPLAAGPARGLSNVRRRETASVTIRRGRLLIVESAATLG